MHDLAAPLRPRDQQLAVGGQAAQDVLGQLGAVDADNQLPAPGPLGQLGGLRRDVVRLRGPVPESGASTPSA